MSSAWVDVEIDFATEIEVDSGVTQSFYLVVSGGMYIPAMSGSSSDAMASDDNIKLVNLAKATNSQWGWTYSNEFSL